jgi:tetratricopeptide (TPR) repeat protein
LKPARRKGGNTPAGLSVIPPGSLAGDRFPAPRSALGRWAFRLAAALLIPVLFLGVLELVLRGARYGYPTGFFIETTRQGKRCIVENQKFTWRFFPRGLARYPEPVLFEPAKPAGTCRIFVLGESAALGDPDPAFGFSRIMEILLQEQFPSARFEILNLAVTAITSPGIREIAAECLPYDADFWLVYMGNNEVVGPFGAGTVFGAQAPGLAFVRTTILLKKLRTVQLIDALLQGLRSGRGLPVEWGGMAMFAQQKIQPGDPRLARVQYHFEQNLAAILRLGREAGARIILSTVAANLKDCAPFASLPRSGLKQEESTAWDQAYLGGIEAQQKEQWLEAVQAFERALKIDGNYADLHYRLGQCLWALKRIDEARTHFIRARDCDALRFRPDDNINAAIGRAARMEGDRLEFVDGAGVIAGISPHSVPGQEHLYEHVHLNFSGNYALARAFAESVASRWRESGTPRASPTWLSAEDCKRRLAYTPWNEYHIWANLQERMEQVPFTFQLDHGARMTNLQRTLTELRPHTKSYALKLTAGAYQKVLSVRTNDAAIWKHFANLVEAMGDYAEAVRAWHRVLDLWPHYAQGRFYLAEVHRRMGNLPEAQRGYQEALALRSSHKEAWNGLGQVFFQAKQAKEALSCYRQALALNPAQPDVHLNLGIALEALGQFKDARWHYAETLRYQPDHPEAQARLKNLDARL